MKKAFLKIWSTEIHRMALLAAFFYGVYYIVYELYLGPGLVFDHLANGLVAGQGAAVLNFLGQEAVVVTMPPYPNLVLLNGHMGVNVGTPCNGMPILYLFLAFALAYPGPVKRKLWYIPLGLFLIHGVNVLRVAALGAINVYSPEWFVVNHKYVYTAIVYSMIIWLWLWWHMRVSNASLSPLPSLFQVKSFFSAQTKNKANAKLATA